MFKPVGGSHPAPEPCVSKEFAQSYWFSEDRLFTLNSLTFLTLNIFTLGLWGTVNSLLKRKDIETLIFSDSSQENDQSAVAEIFQRTIECENNETLSFYSAKKSIVSWTIKEICRTQIKVSKALGKVSSFALKFVGTYFANVATCGVFGVVENQLLKHEVTHLMTRMRNRTAKKVYNIVDFTGQKGSSPKGCLSLTYADSQTEELSNLRSELETARTELTASKSNESALRAIVAQGQSALSEKTHLVDALSRVQQDLETDISRAKADNAKLKEDMTILDRRIAEITSKNIHLITQIEQTERRLLSSSTLERAFREIVPIPPAYSKQTDDLEEIPGGYENPQDPFAELLNSAKTTEGLIEQGLKHIIDILLAGKLEIGKDAVSVKEKALISRHLNFENNKAVYRYFVMLLILNARLCKSLDGEYILKFNDVLTPVGSSKPIKLLDRQAKVRIFFEHSDAFTPKNDKGIDPISLKWILHRLPQELKNKLAYLLLGPLLDQENASLKEAQTLLADFDNKDGELFRTAFELISDLALALEDRFSAPTSKSWDYLITRFPKEQEESSETRFHVLDDFKGGTSSRTLTTWDFESSRRFFGRKPQGASTEKQRLESKERKISSSLKSADFPRRETLTFFDTLTRMQEAYKLVFDNMTKEYVLNPSQRIVSSRLSSDSNAALETLKKQYHISNRDLSHGSLFNSLALITFCEVQALKKENVFQLKKGIARFLEDPNHIEKFEQRIKDKYKVKIEIPNRNKQTIKEEPMTVADYRYWLQYGNTSAGIPIQPSDPSKGVKYIKIDEPGELEIELMAHVLGITIAVFRPETDIALDDNGLIVPSAQSVSSYYGPSTKEVLYLFKGKNGYSALFPRLKVVKNKSFSRAMKDISDYWTTLEIR